MALMSCPECEREVSDRAMICPPCGYPNMVEFFRSWLGRRGGA